MNTKELPCVELLREYFEVIDGEVRWRGVQQNCRSGKIAGNVDKNGYYRVLFDGRMLAAHRIAFKIETGIDPIGYQIDHIDENKKNNSPSNLRLATHELNQGNISSARKDSKSGVRGVCWNKEKNKWRAEINVEGKRKHIGLFSRIEDADAAYKAARAKQNMALSPN